MLVGGKETPEGNELTISCKTNSEIMMAKSEVVLAESPGNSISWRGRSTTANPLAAACEKRGAYCDEFPTELMRIKTGTGSFH
ncbi:MAG: hypothetical protein DME76_15715 [Verrucomicrobia bacterium]|nr:MAG: hypothetical protein DME76_15715 [Verrucomicrobiota bacterium]